MTTTSYDRAQASRSIPGLRRWDSSLALLSDPYRFIGKTCEALGTEVFMTRLMFQPTLCMSGAHAAELFYDTDRFQRTHAAPEALRATLLGKGGVQGLDGAAHRHRKALFVSLTSPDRVARLVRRTRHEWQQALRPWSARGPAPLYRLVQPVLTRAVCDWAGVPIGDADVPSRNAQLVALFDAAAAGPLSHLRARMARWQAEAWLSEMVRTARAGRLRLPLDSPAHAITWHRDRHGVLVEPRIAAVELLNLLRPTVAVSVYITFVAHALHTHALWREVLADVGMSTEARDFAQEVRRHYPFFPAVVARVRHDFEWEGMPFRAGLRSLLDLHGTNHDRAAWDDPWSFKPERWRNRRPGRFDFVPQGGGEVATQHRCPGEDIALQLMVLAMDMLLRHMRYDVPRQDLGIAMNRLPALPRDGFVIERVRPLS